MKTLVFTVTNNLAYDQRMIRICNSLSNAGYNVVLIGTKTGSPAPLTPKKFRQIRLNMWFKKGPLFYIEYNIRLFLFLLFFKADLICCIDLDTILPVYLVSFLKREKRVYDAHEYFSQQKEIVTRPKIYKIWHWIERKFVPQFLNGYTVGHKIAAEFKTLYNVNYEVIRNIPLLKPISAPAKKNKHILYQGAVNEARGLEYLIPAMNQIHANLFIYGDGNFMDQSKALIIENNLADKVFLKDKLLPEELVTITAEGFIGVNLVENIGLNQYYSLANKFFDYIHFQVPQVTMNFPEYKLINDEFNVALLLDNLEPQHIAEHINKLLNDELLYTTLSNNCLNARNFLNWQQEEIKLLSFYKKMFA